MTPTASAREPDCVGRAPAAPYGCLGMSDAQLLTLIVAAWGAVLSTLLAAREVIRDRRRVKVVVLPLISMTRNGEFIDLWRVRVVNVRHRPVEIEKVGVSTRNATRYIPRTVDFDGKPTASPLPRVLADGESIAVTFLVSDEDDKRALTGGWAYDTLGREYTAAYPGRSPRAWWRARKAERRHRKFVRALAKREGD